MKKCKYYKKKLDSFNKKLESFRREMSLNYEAVNSGHFFRIEEMLEEAVNKGHDNVTYAVRFENKYEIKDFCRVLSMYDYDVEIVDSGEEKCFYNYIVKIIIK